MKFIFRMIRNIILLLIVAAIALTIWLKGPFHGNTTEETSTMQTTEDSNTQHYSLEDNALFKNIPLGQVKNVFNLMDKQEFMDVSGLSRMGYNDDYLIGQRNNDFILYHFGDKSVTVFPTEDDLMNELYARNQQLTLQEKSAF